MIAWIRAVIDLLMLRKQERKLDLDIAKGRIDIEKASLELEKLKGDCDAKSVIIGPDQISLDDIQRFDPKAKAVHKMVRRKLYAQFQDDRDARYMRSMSLVPYVIVIVILLVLVAIGIFWK